MHIALWGLDAGLTLALNTHLTIGGHSVTTATNSAQTNVMVIPAQTSLLTQIQKQEEFTGRIVMLSSWRVYKAASQAERRQTGEPITAMLSENAPFRTDSDLQMTEMIAAESLLKQSSQEWVIARLPQTFGPGMPRFFGYYLGLMAAKRPALLLEPGQANWRCTHGFVTDVAAAIAAAVTHQRAANQIYNLGERETPTVGERLHLLARAAGFKGKIMVVPSRMAPKHLYHTEMDYRNDVILDTGRIHRELGFANTTSEKHMWQSTVSWEQQKLAPIQLSSEQLQAEDEVLRKFGLLSR